MQFQLRPHNDNGTTGIVDAFTQKVLTETTVLAFEHVRQGLQRTLVGTGDDATTSAVVEQGVNRLLQHALFVPDDDIRCTQLHEALQTVVTVDHAAIQIVQIRRRETTTIQRHQRAQIGRNDRNNGHDHPFGTVPRLDEGFHNLQTLGQLDRLE